MKKRAFVYIAAIFTISSFAQNNVSTRPLTKVEADNMNKIESAFSNAFPKEWKDWKTESKLQNHTVKDQVSADLGKKTIYTYSYSVVYTIPNEQVDVKMGEAMKRAASFTDANKDMRISALGMKTTSDCKLTVTVESNLGIPYQKDVPVFLNGHSHKTEPQKILIKDTVALAVIGLQPGENLILKGENVQNPAEAKELDNNADYSDEAIIFIGPKASAVKKTTKTFNGTGRNIDSYYIEQPEPNVNSLLVYNILVRIRGNVSEIDEFIKKVDWSVLKKMISKVQP